MSLPGSEPLGREGASLLAALLGSSAPAAHGALRASLAPGLAAVLAHGQAHRLGAGVPQASTAAWQERLRALSAPGAADPGRVVGPAWSVAVGGAGTPLGGAGF